MNTVYSSINLFGDELEVSISYEELRADPDAGLEKELCITAVQLNRAEKWDGNGNIVDSIHSVDLLPYLSEWAVREVEDTVVIRNLERAVLERRESVRSSRAQAAQARRDAILSRD